MPQPCTLFDKIWRRHVVHARDDGRTLLYVDRHLVQDGSAPAFAMLRRRGLAPRAPAARLRARPTTTCRRTAAASPTSPTRKRARMAQALRDGHRRRRHRVLRPRRSRARASCTWSAPEQGLTQPGMLIVCGDSHTSTHGALGALAFGIGASEVAHVLATQTIWQRKPKTLRIAVDGALGAGVSAKDVILAIIAKIGAAGAAGHVIEYAGGDRARRCRWKAASPSATCRSRPARAPA